MWIDNGACNVNTCSGYCETVYNVVRIGAGFEEPYYLITIDEICDNFQFIQAYFSTGNKTCQQVFNDADLNNNSVIGMYELIVNSADEWLINTLPHSQEKLEQIDCSNCLDNQTLYYL